MTHNILPTTTVDTSSQAAFVKSLDEIRMHVAEEDRERFEAAVEELMYAPFINNGKKINLDKSINDEVLDKFCREVIKTQFAANPEIYLDVMKSYFDGKTAHEIMINADKCILSRLERETTALQKRILLNETKLNKVLAEKIREDIRMTASRMIVEQILIDQAQYCYDKSFSTAYLNFRITNNTSIPIRKIYIDGILKTPGRSIPWIKDSITCKFPGGLEPNEQRLINLETYASEWEGEADGYVFANRDDLVLTLRVSDFKGPDGERIVAQGGDSDLAQTTSDLERHIAEDRKRIEGLTEQISEIRHRIPS